MESEMGSGLMVVVKWLLGFVVVGAVLVRLRNLLPDAGHASKEHDRSSKLVTRSRSCRRK